MKKLLILMLVLGMASIAAATPINVDLNLTTSDAKTIGTTITVEFSMTQKAKTVANIDFTSTGTNALTLGSWQQGASPQNPGTATTNLINDADAGWVTAVNADVTLYEFDVYIGEAGWINMAGVGNLANPDYGFGDPADEMYYTVANLNGLYVPEPMTIALLGLGALFLRRRK